MENASKALIIAGAILLSILLISLGIMIFNQAQDTVTESGMSEAAISSFNNKFLKYEGKQKGTMVKSMIQEVLANNAGASGTDNQTVKVKYIKTGGTTPVNGTETPTTSEIKNNNTYEVKMNYAGSAAGGRISEIEVKGSFN